MIDKPMELAHFESLYPPQTREKEVKKIITHVKSGASCQVAALPGTGRSNVLEFLAYNKGVRENHLGENSKWFHFVYMDCSEIRKRPPHEVVKFILISLSYSLAERKMTEEHEMVNEILKDAVSFNDELILFQALKKAIDYLAIEKQLTIVFLFDRFDQYTQDITDQFFANLKILRNRAKYRFSSIFSLARPLEDILEANIYADFYEFLIGNTIYLDLYDRVGTQFRREYLEKITGKKLSDAIDKELIALTGGHGKLTRVSRESLIVGPHFTGKLSSFLMTKAHVQGALHEIWGALLPDEQTLVFSQKYSDAKGYLINTGLIHNGKLTIPLFAEFIKQLPTTTDATIAYDEARNEIIKNGEAITDLLSPSEFRLLRFLVQNKDKVSEKEEIINAVWKDSKTQEGVTDQALDQIIYRLRKKIEDDPNNPHFIQTIKGRGYRFSL